MKNKYTFSDLCYDVLAKENAPLTPDAIWKKAVEIGLDKQLGTTGKTPSASIGARLYVDIRDNGEESKFVQVSKRPALFMLRGNDLKKADIEKAVEKQEIAAEKITSTYNERDLHPLLVKYVNANQHFKCYTKTIFHENSAKKIQGFNKWLHPDLVGVYYPFNDYETSTTNLQKSLYVNSIKMFSFEMKKELNFAHLREYFFQAVSNSSWANEGYLVALKIDEDPEFQTELQRLSNSFGIGIIKLDAENIEDSEIICPARYREIIDWDTLNRLVEDSPDFKTFITNVNDSITIKKAKKNEYDEILDDEKYEKHIKDKKIV